MDLNFHYYAVKTLAFRAGFSEEDAQTIANYSQFVDDYTKFFPMVLDDVPEFAQHLGVKFLGVWIFWPVTTGFDSWVDMLRLVTEEHQKTITVPFHFIPPHTKLNEKITGDNRVAWRVVPAHMSTDSLIRELMLGAKKDFQDNPDNRKVNLMHIGMLLHTFADTYAHQNFSGFWGWENYCKLTRVVDNVTNKDITASYEPDLYYLIPAIGHPEANHAPDDSNVTFDVKMLFKEEDMYKEYPFSYRRSNTSEYCILAREIINFLSDCLGKEPPAENEWEELCLNLAKGFLTSQKEPIVLNRHWGNIFKDISYHYSKETMMNELLEQQDQQIDGIEDVVAELHNHGIEANPTLYKVKSEDFFHYNVLADEIRNFVNDENIGEIRTERLKKALESLGK